MVLSRSFRTLAVILPLVMLGYSVVRSEMRLRASQEWEFRVSGYDPRDLLHGHYIRFRIDFAESGGRSCADNENCCLCLSREDDGLTSSQRMSCGQARNACEGILETGSLSTLTRYYVPESRALDMERQLQRAMADRNARIVLAIDKRGRPQIARMTIGGTPLE